MKIDANGNSLWFKTYGDLHINWIDFIIETKDKNLLVSGRNYSYKEKIDEIFLSKIDSDGNLIWTEILNKKDADFNKFSEHKLKNGILIIGKIYNPYNDMPNIYITKLNSDGDYDWSKNLGKEFYEWGYYNYNNYDGTAMIIGLSEEIKETKTDIYLIKKTKNGQINKIFGGDEFDWGYSLIRVKDGYLITGNTFSFGNGLSDIYLIKVDADGNCIFAKTIGDKGYDDCYNSVEDDNGFLIGGGATTSYSKGGYDIYLVKTDYDGNVIWTKTFGEKSDDACYAITKTDDNCFVIGGITGKTIIQ